MGVITSIEPQKRNPNRVSIFVDDKFYKGLSLYLCKKNKLIVGMTIDEEHMNDILTEELYEEGKTYVTKYCMNKPEKNVRERLKRKEYDEKTIDRLIAFMKEYGFMNDERYAMAFAKDSSKFSKHGKKKIEYDLLSKGIKPDVVNKAVGNVSDEEQVEAAYKKLKTKIDSYKRKSNTTYELKGKCYAFLLRNGFESDIINKVISMIMDEQ